MTRVWILGVHHQTHTSSQSYSSWALMHRVALCCWLEPYAVKTKTFWSFLVFLIACSCYLRQQCCRTWQNQLSAWKHSDNVIGRHYRTIDDIEIFFAIDLDIYHQNPCELLVGPVDASRVQCSVTPTQPFWSVSCLRFVSYSEDSLVPQVLTNTLTPWHRWGEISAVDSCSPGNVHGQYSIYSLQCGVIQQYSVFTATSYRAPAILNHPFVWFIPPCHLSKTSQPSSRCSQMSK